MEVIKPLAASGELPTLARLMHEGISAPLLSTPNMHSASAWTSILTGLNPGRHGLFVFSDRNYATGRQEFFKGGDRAGETIAAHLAQHHLTSGFLNVPMTYPAQCQTGSYMISGLDAPALNEQAFCPTDLRAELFDKFPGYAFTPTGLGDMMSAGRIDAAIAAWLKLTETQTAAAEYLIQSRPTDFFMTVYTASDWGGHNLWKVADVVKQKAESHNANLSDGLRSIYRALDAAVARLLMCTNEQTQVYVISDHGMGLHTGASYHLAAWLEANGYMIRKSAASSRATLFDAGRRAAKNLLPVAIKEKLKARVGPERIKRMQATEKDSFYATIDWATTLAYTEPGRHVININLAGRNAQGKVAPEDYDTVCAQLREALSRWQDARGVPAVERVARRDEVYSGPYVERASDLYVYWNPEADFGDPPREVQARGFWWSGDHRPEGILIGKGPGLEAGAQIDGAAVYDLLPTMLYGAGLPVPSDLDGQVLQRAFTDSFVAAHPLREAARAAHITADQLQLSDDEEELIEEKLRALGYL